MTYLMIMTAILMKKDEDLLVISIAVETMINKFWSINVFMGGGDDS